MYWSDDRVEILKKLWSDGFSASQIAADLGGISRNSVIGKVHRLGLSGRAKRPSSSVPRRPRTPKQPRICPENLQSSMVIRNPAPLPAECDALEPEPGFASAAETKQDIPLGQRRTLLELSDGTCRWPVGEPSSEEFFYCGGKPVDGLPYCGSHSRIAYQPSADRRRRRRSVRSEPVLGTAA